MNKHEDSQIILSICDKYDITQSQLARETGKTKQYISNIVNGKTMSKELYDKLLSLYPDCFNRNKFILPEEIDKDVVIAFRKYYRLSKAKLAEKLNVNPTLIGLIEKEERNVSKRVKNRIRKLYTYYEKTLQNDLSVSTQNEYSLEDFTNRNDVKVITIDKSVKYLVIKIDDVK